MSDAVSMIQNASKFGPGAVWMVKTTDPGFDICRCGSVVAVNFHVRENVAGVPEADLVARLRGTASARFARQLSRFINDMESGDTIVTKVGKRWAAGEVVGDYRYDPGVVNDHPHLRPVRWSSDLLDDQTAEAIEAARRSRYATVERLHLGQANAVFQSSVAARSPQPALHASVTTEAVRISSKPGVRPRWPAVDDGPPVPCQRTSRSCGAPHTMYRHTATLLDEEVAGAVLLVVGLNPSCPDDLNQPTFQPIRRVGLALGARWVGIVNLLALRAPDLATLSPSTTPAQLLGDTSRVLAAMLPQVDAVIAGWGLKPGAGASDIVEAIARAAARETLARCEHAGVPVYGMGGQPRHPSRWLQWIRTGGTQPGEEATLLSQQLLLISGGNNPP